MSLRNKNNFWAESCFKILTCSFDDLPDGCRGGWHHGPLVQTQFTNVHDVEAVHVLLWSDGVAHCSLVDVLWGGWRARTNVTHQLLPMAVGCAAGILVVRDVPPWLCLPGSGSWTSRPLTLQSRFILSISSSSSSWETELGRTTVSLEIPARHHRWCTCFTRTHRNGWRWEFYPGCWPLEFCSSHRCDWRGLPRLTPLPDGVSCYPERPVPPHRAGFLFESDGPAPCPKSPRLRA